MTGEPLTGRRAVEALSVCFRLARQEARFDRRGVAAALRTAAGRGRIVAGLSLRLRAPARLRGATRGVAARRPRSRPLTAAAAHAAPDRPQPPPRPAPAGEGR